MLTDILIIMVLLVLNAILTAIDLAILSVNKIKIRQKAEEGDPKAILIKEASEDANLLPSIAIAYTIVGMLIGTYSGIAFAAPISELIVEMGSFGANLSYSTLETVVIIIITIIMSYLSIVIVETIPKRLAIRYSEKISYAVIKPLIVFAKIIKPVAVIFSASVNLVTKLFRLDNMVGEEGVTEEDIRMMVNASDENVDGIEADEKEMIKNVFEFNDKVAEEVVTHRTDIVALNIEATYDEVVNIIHEDHSRIPVYSGDLDNIQGVVHIKDLMKHILDIKDKKLDLKSILRPPYYVPSSKKLDDLFREMKRDSVYFSIVIDEYGGVYGILTMEDLIEEIMGNIMDEYDTEEEPEILVLEDGTYIIQGIAHIEHVNDELNLELPTEEYDTLGGFVVGQMGRIPQDGDEDEITYNNITYKILEVSEKRIQKLLVSRIQEVPETEETPEVSEETSEATE